MALKMMIGKLTPDELNEIRAITARENAYTVHPDGFSATEIEQHEMRKFRLTGGFLEKYQVDPMRDWRISNFTGDIWYED